MIAVNLASKRECAGGGGVYDWLLVMMVMWLLHIHRQPISEDQLL